MSYSDLLEELEDIRKDSILNESQKARFIETTMHSFMLMLDARGLEEIQSAIRLAPSRTPDMENPSCP